MFKVILLGLLFCLPINTSVASDVAMPDDVLMAKAKAFVAAKNARQQPDTKVSDIDHFLSLLADDFIDEHLKYGVVITDKDELRIGMIRKMEDDIRFSEMKINQIMVGNNVAFVKFTEHVILKREGSAELVDHTGVTVISLEFDEHGLIKHIRRHND